MHAVLTHVVATGHVLAGGCDGCNAVDWLKWLFAQVGDLVNSGFKVSAALLMAGILFFRRTIKYIALGLFMCGVAFYSVIGGGVQGVGNMIGRMMPNSGVVTQIIQP